MHGCVATDIRLPGGDTKATQPEIPPDEMLLERIASGERPAFALLVERHTQRYYRLAYRCVFQQAEAEDIVQEAFLKLWQQPGLWRKERGARFTTWFYRLVVNLCHDHNKRKRPVPLPEDWDGADSAPGADEMMDQARRQRAVEAALRRLPPRQQAAMALCFFEGVSNREAADILGIRIKALESLLMRAKGQLKQELKDYC